MASTPSHLQDVEFPDWIRERVRQWSPLEPAERSFVEEQMKTTQPKRDALNSHLADIQAQIDALTSQRDALQKEQDILDQQLLISCRSLLAPIRRLPAEILLEIFSLLSPTIIDCSFVEDDVEWGGTGEMEPIMSHSFPYIALEQVCSTWHQLVTNTPSLWSRIEFEIWDTDPELLSKVEERMEEVTSNVLYRGHFPLDIQVSYWPDAEGDIVYCIWDNCSRFKRLHLKLHEHVSQYNMELFSVEFPSLETLVLENDGSYITWPFRLKGEVPVDWFSDCSKLREVQIIGDRLGVFILPWSQLESLSVVNEREASTKGTMKTLGKASSLRKLKFGHPTCDVQTKANAALKSLPIDSLQTMHPADLDFFASFTFPNLTKLNIGGASENNLFVFLSNFAPTLQQLTFEGDKHPFMLGFLESSLRFPELTDLTVRSSYCTGTLETQVDDFAQRFPKLAHLTCNLNPESLDSWFTVFQRLRKVSSPPVAAPDSPFILDGATTYMDFLPEKLKLVLRDLKSEGLEVTILAILKGRRNAEDIRWDKKLMSDLTSA